MPHTSNAHDPIVDGPLPPMPKCRHCGHAWSKHRASDDLCPFQDNDGNSFYEPVKPKLIAHGEPPAIDRGFDLPRPTNTRFAYIEDMVSA